MFDVPHMSYFEGYLPSWFETPTEAHKRVNPRPRVMPRMKYTGRKGGGREDAWRADMGSSSKRKRTGSTRKVGFYGRYNDPYHGTEEREKKFIDSDVNDAVVAQNGTVLTDTINAIAQGVQPSQRVGRKAIIKNINWRWTAVLESEASGGAQSSETLRIILFLDRQANGALATVLSIIEQDDWQSYNSLVNKGRFTILYDNTIDLNPVAAAGNGTVNDWAENSRSGSFYKECNIPIEFDGPSGAITEIRSNNLGVLLISRAGTPVVFASKFRLRFFD